MTIDFVSTRDGLDIQSQRCARLIGAVIAQSLKDLMEKPSKEERVYKINLNKNAIRSIYFFKSQTFINYAAMVGFDGKEFLDRILIGGTTIEYNGEEWVTKVRKISSSSISDMELRTIRARLRWRCTKHVELLPTTEEDIADEAAWDEAERLLEEKNKRAKEKKEREDAKRENNNGKGCQHAVDRDRVHGVSKTGRDKVDTQVSTTKRRNANVSRA
jgi:hypothetical protein